MSINLADYPRLIALPYQQTLNENVQRKEYQRFCLELLLSFNAIVCLSDFVRIKSDDKEVGKYKNVSLEKLKVDLGQMSLGKWNALGREVSKVLMNDMSADVFVPDIYELYHNKKKADWNKNVDDLIARRNADAHGAITSEEKLSEELVERQGMLEVVLQLTSFYEKYVLIVPYDSEISEGKTSILCKDFYGVEEKIYKIQQTEEELDFNQPYLYHKEKKSFLPLLPMLACYPQTKDSKDSRIFVYSKTLNRKQGSLHYYNSDGTWDFTPQEKEAVGSYLSPSSFCSAFESFRVHVEHSELIDQKQPTLVVNRYFKEASCGLGDDVAEVVIEITNEGEVEAEEVNGRFDYPRVKSFEQTNETFDSFNRDLIKIDIDTLDPGEKWTSTYYFKPHEAGQYEFDPISFEYSYTNQKGERVEPSIEAGINVVECPPLFIEVFDPNDPDSLLPIVNLNLSYSNECPTIGDEITFNVNVKNIGRSIAKNVEVYIFPPDKEIEILSGSTSWKGNLNPGESVTSQFILKPREHGVFSMRMRDIIFQNQKGVMFKTLAYEDYKILVQNDPKIKYRYLMEDVWGDLVLDEDEVKQIEYFNSKYCLDQDENKNAQIQKDIQSEVQLKITKEVIKEVFNKASLKYNEVVKGECIWFFLKSVPVFILDYNDYTNLKLLVRGDVAHQLGQLEIVPYKKKRQRHAREIKFTRFDFEQITQQKTGGTSLLKSVTNRALRGALNSDILLLELGDQLADFLCIQRNDVEVTQFDNGYVRYLLRDASDNRFVSDHYYAGIDDDGLVNLIVCFGWPADYKKRLSEIGICFENGDYLTGDFKVAQKRSAEYFRLNKKPIKYGSKHALFDPLKEFTLKTLEFFEEDRLKEYGLDENDQAAYDSLREIISVEVGDFIFTGIDDREMVVYKGSEPPYFPKSKQIMQIFRAKRGNNKFVARFRVADGSSSCLPDGVRFDGRSHWPYVVDINEENLPLLRKLVNFAAMHSGEERQILTCGVVSYLVNSKSDLKNILDELEKANFEMKISDVDSAISSKSGYTIRGLNLTLNKWDYEHLVDYGKRYVDEEPIIEVKKKYRELVRQALAQDVCSVVVEEVPEV